MEIQCLKACKRKMASGAEQTYPEGWSGDVPDADAKRFIAEGRAHALAGGASSELTAEETAVLKAAAQQALAATLAGGQSGGETVDPETGEISDEGSQDPADVLASMTRKELDALAKQNNVKYTARKRADVEADLLALIEANPA
jgi:hypothetical protein